MTTNHGIRVGSRWRDWDGDEVVVLSVDEGTEYPIQFRWIDGQSDGTTGRGTIATFTRDFHPLDWATVYAEHAEAIGLLKESPDDEEECDHEGKCAVDIQTTPTSCWAHRRAAFLARIDDGSRKGTG